MSLKQVTIQVANVVPAPIPGCVIDVFDALNVNFLSRLLTDAWGEAVLTIDPGIYALRIWASGYTILPPGPTLINGVRLTPTVSDGFLHKTAAAAFAQDFYGAAHNGTRWVVAGAGGEIQTSDDGGSTWVHRAAAEGYTGDFHAACFGDGRFVLVGTSGEIQTSTDGEIWYRQSFSGSASISFRGVAYGNGLYNAVGISTDTGEGQIFYSADAASWSPSGVPGGPGWLNAVAYGNDAWCVVGASGYVATSDDGWAWTPRSGPGRDLWAVFNNGSLWCLAGANGEIYTSATGATWTRQYAASGFTGTFSGLTWGDGSWCLASQDDAEIQMSADAETWQHQAPATGFSGGFGAAAFGNHRFLVAGGAGEIEVVGADFTVTINSVSYTYAAAAFASASNVTAGLKAAMAAATQTVADNHGTLDILSSTLFLATATANLTLAIQSAILQTALEVTEDATVAFVGESPMIIPPPGPPNLCAVYGTVRDVGGTPVANAKVVASAATPQVINGTQEGAQEVCTVTDADGYFRVDLERLSEVNFSIENTGLNVIRTVPDLATQDVATWT